MMERSQSKGACGNDPLTRPVLHSWALSYLTERGINLATGQASRLCSLSAREIPELLDQNQESAHCGGLGIPYFDEAGRLLTWRVRLQEGELRYLVKKGEEMRPYFPPFVEETRWKDPRETLYVVESPIKALSLAQEGWLTVGLAGVDAGALHRSAWREGGVFELHPDLLRRLALSSRSVVLVFDAGAAINARVALALAKTEVAFRKAGALVYAARLPLRPDGGDQGPDDVKVRLGVEGLKERLNAALPADPLQRVRALLELDSFRARHDGVRALLEELPVQAALYLGGVALRDALAAEAKAALSKAALTEVQKNFKAKLLEKRREKEEGANTHETQTRTIIRLPDNRDDVLVAQSIQALKEHPLLYQRAGALVRVSSELSPERSLVTRPVGAMSIRPIPASLLRLYLAQVTDWRLVVQTRHGEELKPVPVPARYVESLFELGNWPLLRYLEAVTEIPVLRPDGKVLCAPGYDADTGIYYQPIVEFPPIPEHPTKEELTCAVKTLQDVVRDFPFASLAHQAAFLAALLTPFARLAFEGCVPLFAIGANVRGAGKTTLADVVSWILCGQSMPRYGYRADDAELAKAITAAVSAADPFLLLDNVDKPLGGEALDRALTGTVWKERVLGVNAGPNAFVEAPQKITFFATGNNLVYHGDTYSRTLPIRLESALASPDERKDFAHPDLKAMVLERRPQLVASCLLILRAYQAAGCPKVLSSPTRFREWDRWVRGAVVFALGVDPKDARDEDATIVDSDASALGQLLDAWEELSDGTALTVAGALSRYEESLRNQREYQKGKKDHELGLQPHPGTPPPSYPLFAEMLANVFGVLPGESLRSARPLGERLKLLKGRRDEQCRFFTFLPKAASSKTSASWVVRGPTPKPG
jgi:hypothetical protein